MVGLNLVLVLAVISTSASAQTLAVLYSFTGGTDGSSPYTALVRDTAGNLYGTTARGGDSNCDRGLSCGVVFKLDVHGTETVLHTFTGGADGAYPTGTLIRDAAGNLYGTAYNGGGITCEVTAGCGMVFKLDPTVTFTVLHAFAGGMDGALPDGGVIRDSSGNLYGTTSFGGASDSGTVFKVDATGKETVLYSFTGKADGGQPIAGVIRDAAGNLFGTTPAGGTRYLSAGTAYKVDTTGKETVLHKFVYNGSGDGLYPYAGLVPSGENLYGTTSGGGTSGYGALFRLDKAGNETVLYSFTGGTDGRDPENCGLVHDSAGNLYGTTEFGGDSDNDGTVFELDPSGKETVLHVFTKTEGTRPVAGVIRDAAGNLYGTTTEGGAFGWGTVFKITT
jgi:uncharacterized repeat protein (TIGR03803 family)